MLETEDGEEAPERTEEPPELRELRDGTSDSLSLSSSLSSSLDSSRICCWANLAVSCSRVGCANCSVRTLRDSWGLYGFGLMIWDLSSGRPFGTPEEECRA